MDPLFVVEAFHAGADGIFVGGWHPGECHYQVGNYDAIVTAHVIRKILARAGIRLERFVLDWASAAEAPLFVDLIKKFTKQIKELGPLGEAEAITREELQSKILAAKSTVESIKLKTRLGRLTADLRLLNDYSPGAIEAKMAEKLNDAIKHEFEKQIDALGP
jgi:F420-non-reducing hydrogenase iron-sulfur subunit